MRFYAMKDRHVSLLCGALILTALCKSLWAIWILKDLTDGDTSRYFNTAYEWFLGFKDNILWSPLYTTFYGIALSITHDAYGATILHRCVIVVLAAIGVFFFFRRIMSVSIAALLTVWWILLPINFNTLYEVHLFALLPMLIVLILSAGKCNTRERGLILSLLIGITVLVRNEVGVVLFIFFVFCVIKEYRIFRTHGVQNTLQSVGLWYLAPCISIALIITYFYHASVLNFPEFDSSSHFKHTLNMCQVYSFGYSQRHPTYIDSPWTDCMALMKATFGSALPSLKEMILANPGATLRHFVWNLSLAPNGLQLALFDASSGLVDPDYVPFNGGHSYILLVSIGFIAVLFFSAWTFFRRSNSIINFWKEWDQLIMIVMALTVTAILIVITQRPRPSYLFSFTVCLMAVLGVSLDWLTRQRVVIRDTAAFLIAAVVAISSPFYFYQHPDNRDLLQLVSVLEPYRALLIGSTRRVVIGDFVSQITSYLHLFPSPADDADDVRPADELYPAISGTPRIRELLDYSSLTNWDHIIPIETYLDQNKIDALVIQPRMWSMWSTAPGSFQIFNGQVPDGWRYFTPGGRQRFGVLLRQAEDTELPNDLQTTVASAVGVSATGHLSETGHFVLRRASGGVALLTGQVTYNGSRTDEYTLEIGSHAGSMRTVTLHPGSLNLAFPLLSGSKDIDFTLRGNSVSDTGKDDKIAVDVTGLSINESPMGTEKASDASGMRNDANAYTQGITQDGWVGPLAFVQVHSVGQVTMTIEGLVPGGIGLDKQHVIVGYQRGVIERDLPPGNFNIAIPMLKGENDVSFDFKQQAPLPNGDGRIVSALVKALQVGR